ncbi:MAG: hypothetical protein J5493_01755 [Lachnospiraceae bacterium]|nr:hypothetical protein [Lachnospiraceae bacterium]
MHLLKEDSFFEVLARYPACCVDYFLLRDEEPYQGEPSHRKAVLCAMAHACDPEEEPWKTEPEKAAAEQISAADLLAFPDEPWKHDRHGTVFYDNVYEDGKIPYWYAFLEPPYGTGAVVRHGRIVRNAYGREDFETVNTALFPRGTDRLTVYRWSTNWSAYFDDGHEWWGAACWSIYDPEEDRYAVILVSATD